DIVAGQHAFIRVIYADMSVSARRNKPLAVRREAQTPNCVGVIGKSPLLPFLRVPEMKQKGPLVRASDQDAPIWREAHTLDGTQSTFESLRRAFLTIEHVDYAFRVGKRYQRFG